MALRLSNEIDLLVKPFPKERAADSVVLNIAEGSTGQTIPEYKRFLGIVLRSAIEVVACLFISNTRKYIDDKDFRKYYDEYEVLSKMISKLRSSM